MYGHSLIGKYQVAFGDNCICSACEWEPREALASCRARGALDGGVTSFIFNSRNAGPADRLTAVRCSFRRNQAWLVLEGCSQDGNRATQTEAEWRLLISKWLMDVQAEVRTFVLQSVPRVLEIQEMPHLNKWALCPETSFFLSKVTFHMAEISAHLRGGFALENFEFRTHFIQTLKPHCWASFAKGYRS